MSKFTNLMATAAAAFAFAGPALAPIARMAIWMRAIAMPMAI